MNKFIRHYMKALVVLHVEDDPNDVFLLKRAFRKASLDIHWQSAADGQEALDYFRACCTSVDPTRFPIPDIVLLDLKIPVLSGFEVLAWVRAHAEVKHLPIFVLTSSNHPGDKSRAEMLGANRYIVKTHDFEEVIHSVRTWPQFTAVGAPSSA